MIWDRVQNVSRIMHDILYRDASQSLCARAWGYRHEPFWGLWVRVFGWNHCRDSWLFYHGDD